MEAIQLVDHVLDQSVLIINAQQLSSNTLHSESENFAITCDINGDLMKSPTIESMSGKSFDDNISVSDVTDARADLLKQNSSTTDLNNFMKTDYIKPLEQLSDIDIDGAHNNQQHADFDNTMSNINSDELYKLQCEFSKISWDDTVSATTADSNILTPDNDLHEYSKGDFS